MLTKLTNFISKIARINYEGDNNHRVEVGNGNVKVYINNTEVGSFDATGFDVTPNSLTKAGVEVATVADLAAAQNPLHFGMLSGLDIDPITTPTAVTIGVGAARGENDAEDLELTSTITKTLAAWTAGTAVGGVASGALPLAGSGYTKLSVWAISNGTLTDIILDDNEAGSNILADVTGTYDNDRRRIGWVIYDGAAGELLPIRQYGDFFQMLIPTLSFNDTANKADYISAAGRVVTTNLPPSVLALISPRIETRSIFNGAEEAYGIVTETSVDLTAVTPNETNQNWSSIAKDSIGVNNNTSYKQANTNLVLLDSSSTFKMKTTNIDNGTTFIIDKITHGVYGWYDNRGKG